METLTPTQYVTRVERFKINGYTDARVWIDGKETRFDPEVNIPEVGDPVIVQRSIHSGRLVAYPVAREYFVATAWSDKKPLKARNQICTEDPKLYTFYEAVQRANHFKEYGWRTAVFHVSDAVCPEYGKLDPQ